MKNLNTIPAFLLTAILMLIGGNIQAQTTVCDGEEVCLTLPATVRGNIQWESSSDSLSYSPISGQTGDTLCIVPNADTWYRAEITEGSCDPLYSDTTSIKVNPAIIADAGPDGSLCSGAPPYVLNTSVSGSAGPFSYQWTPAAGLSSATIANPSAAPFVTTDYVFTATDLNTGCSDSDSVTVSVFPAPTASAGADTSINCGTSTTIGGNPSASGGTPPYVYSWSPAAGLSSATAPNPVASPNGTTTYALTVIDANGCPSATDSVTVTVIGSSTGTQTFAFTGAVQTFVVPPCADTLFLETWGAQGGNDGTTAGGLGGFASGTIIATPGETLFVYVGGKGTDGPGSGQNCNLAGGFNGGGNTGSTCCSNAGGGAGAGGGASDIRRSGQALGDRIIVAGAGGGSGSNQSGATGGGLTGGNGGAYQGVPSTGGSQTAGGQAGGHFTSHTCSAGTNGSLGQGGIGDGNDGGGGGGGYYGGGGGSNNAGGAGGSSYYGGVTGGSTTAGIRSGDGQVIITW